MVKSWKNRADVDRLTTQGNCFQWKDDSLYLGVSPNGRKLSWRQPHKARSVQTERIVRFFYMAVYNLNCKIWAQWNRFSLRYREFNTQKLVCGKYGSFELLQEEINFYTFGHTFWTKLESSFTLKKWCFGASILRERTAYRFDQYYTLRKACGPLTIHRYKYELEGGA